MKYFILIPILVGCICLLTACKDKQENLVRDTAVEISFSDKHGNDLLDPAFTNAFNSENTDLYYFKDGQPEPVYNGTMNNPKGFIIFQAGTKHLIRIFPSEYVHDRRTITHIQFNKNDTDTIVCQMKTIGKSNKSVIVTKVWYNEELVWDGTGPRYFNIIKE